jgi:hypothetical protein
LALGIAFTSKYTSILLPITSPQRCSSVRRCGAAARDRVRTSRASSRRSSSFQSSIGTRQHDWISFLFQIEHGLGTPKGSPLKRELDLIGGQLGLVSPILFVLAAHAVWRTLAPSERRRALPARGGCRRQLVFFAYSAMRRSVEANWPRAVVRAGIALLAALASTPLRDKWIKRGIVFAAAMVAVIFVHSLVPILPLPARP